MSLPESFRIDGRVALVTGAGRGIGLAIAQALANAGGRVAIQDIDRDVAEREAAALRDAGHAAVALGGDATVLADVERWPVDAAVAFDAAGVDVLVNNASIQTNQPFDAWPVEEAARILDANVLHVWRLCQLVAPHMRGQRWGRILNIGSIQGFRGSINMGPYSISKGAIHNLTLTLAHGLARDNVTVNAIAPGVVDTLRNRDYFEKGGAEQSAKWVPLGRAGVPGDYAAPALLLCSDAGAYITGAILPVDGARMHIDLAEDVTPMTPFVRLADPATYVACGWNLSEDRAGRAYWVDFFIKHLETLLSLGIAAATRRGEPESSATSRADACRAEFTPHFRAFEAAPESHPGRVTILTMDEWRDGLLSKHGFVDAMIDLKDAENEKVIGLLPAVCHELDAHVGNDQLATVIKGVFAGNLFDMGAKASAKMFREGKGPSFFETRGQLAPRPWRIDDFDALLKRCATHIHRRAVYFVDNAGSDFLLGATPMIRWLARRGTHVVIAANERPTLNDMTVHDIRQWWPRVLEVEPSLRDLPIEIVSTGTGEPLIDLSKVSDELNAASADADLVILEGMGRGVESNLDAAFDCDALNLAMIKDDSIAARIGGRVFDCVCRFR